MPATRRWVRLGNYLLAGGTATLLAGQAQALDELTVALIDKQSVRLAIVSAGLTLKPNTAGTISAIRHVVVSEVGISSDIQIQVTITIKVFSKITPNILDQIFMKPFNSSIWECHHHITCFDIPSPS